MGHLMDDGALKNMIDGSADFSPVHKYIIHVKSINKRLSHTILESVPVIGALQKLLQK